MPNIVCPTCATKLEIDDDMVGQDVQCGSCQQIFKAEAEKKSAGRRGDDGDKPRKSKYRQNTDDEDDRPSRRRRSRDDDDDDDYEDRRPSRRRSQQEGGTGMGTASLILGIIGILAGCCCGLFGIPLPVLAIIFGVLSMKTPGKGMGTAGIVMGVIGLILVVLSIIVGFGNMAMNGGGGGGPFNQGRVR